ncbi:hypothetical protein QQ056_11165 [Oscillatoria laete-virens NRMC-F 0139]|nr:hypothetical protein [Oscillatoria laete-virens]MDL5054100.1 hypothetical protein [Oscillatoria laete-virens NRMC-F 0139]
MNDLDREKWKQQQEQLKEAAAIILDVLTKLPANSKAFAELTEAVAHIAAAEATFPDFRRDPSL